MAYGMDGGRRYRREELVEALEASQRGFLGFRSFPPKP